MRSLVGLIIVVSMCLCSGVQAQSQYPGQADGKLAMPNVVSVKAEAFALARGTRSARCTEQFVDSLTV